MHKITRRQVADAFVSQYLTDKSDKARQQTITALAAMILEEKMHNQIDILLRDIVLAQKRQSGVLSTELTSRFKLTDKVLQELSAQLKKLTGADRVIFENHTDERILGGVRVQTPTAELDLSLSRRLQDFKQATSVI